MNPRKILLNARSYCAWRLVGRARGEPLIRVVGDSHTKAFFGARGFYVHHIGPATAYNLCRLGNSTRSNEKLMAVVQRMDREHDALMLSFGEADCRIHIFDQFKRQEERVSITELIDRTVKRYGEIMGQLRERGVRFFVYGLLPATHQPNRYKAQFYAPPEMRVRIYREFNARLASLCAEREILYIDIQSATSDADGFIAPEYARGDTHLNRKVVPIVRRLLAEAGVLT